MGVNSLLLLRVVICAFLGIILIYMLSPKWACVQTSPPADLFMSTGPLNYNFKNNKQDRLTVTQNRQQSLLVFIGYIHQGKCGNEDLCNSPFTYCRQLLTDRCPGERQSYKKPVAPFGRFIDSNNGCLEQNLMAQTLSIKIALLGLILNFVLLIGLQQCLTNLTHHSEKTSFKPLNNIPYLIIVLFTTLSGIVIGALMFNFYIEVPAFMTIACADGLKINGLCPLPRPNINNVSLVEHPWGHLCILSCILIILCIYHAYYSICKHHVYVSVHSIRGSYDLTRVKPEEIEFERICDKKSANTLVVDKRQSKKIIVNEVPESQRDRIIQPQLHTATSITQINDDTEEWLDVELDTSTESMPTAIVQPSDMAIGNNRLVSATASELTSVHTAQSIESDKNKPILLSESRYALQLPLHSLTPIDLDRSSLHTAHSIPSLGTAASTSSEKPDQSKFKERRMVTFADDHGRHLEYQLPTTASSMSDVFSTVPSVYSEETFVTAQSEVSSTRQAVIKQRQEPQF